MGSRGANASPGDIIAGRYRIEGWVGQGNMAMVFRATHLGTGRACALKLVHAHLVERPEIQEMFVQEARVGGRIGKNPYIVDVFDAGIDSERGVPFLAMDLLEGTTLDKYIKEYGAMPAGLLKTLWTQLADALEQAHAAGVVHRDLKPGNLFLAYDRKGSPQLKVVDFGIAKFLERGAPSPPTQVGTPAYAAPEQMGTGMRALVERAGQRVANEISPMTDVWALGVITYEMLTGAHAGQLWGCAEGGSVPDLMARVGTGIAPCASAAAGDRAHFLPRGFDAWLERALQVNAADRWPSIDIAVKRLIALLDANAELPTNAASHEATGGHAAHHGPGGTLRMPPQRDTAEAPKNPTATLRSTEHTLPTNAATTVPAPDVLQGREAPDLFSDESPPPDATIAPTSDTLPPTRAQEARRFGLMVIGAVFGLLLLVVTIAFYVSKKSNHPETTEIPAVPPPPVGSYDVLAPKVEPVPSASPSAPASSSPPDDPSFTPSSTASVSPPTAPVLPRNMAHLSIGSSPVANIVLDGRKMGQTPKIKIHLAPGQHTFYLFAEGRKPYRETVSLKPGQHLSRAIKIQ